MLETIRLPECPHCGTMNVAAELRHHFTHGTRKTTLWECGHCHRGIIREERVLPGGMGFSNFELEAMYPPIRTVEAPEGTPEHIAKFYRAAEKILRRGDPDMLPSAATNARHAIELALVSLGAEGGSLKQKIANAQSRGLIVPVLETWATEIREIGNEGTHEIDLDANDIAQAVYFAEMLLTCLYTLPAMIEDRKARKAARQ